MTLAWVTPHPEMTATAATVTATNFGLMADPVPQLSGKDQ
jgi:hypothetical protein